MTLKEKKLISEAVNQETERCIEEIIALKDRIPQPIIVELTKNILKGNVHLKHCPEAELSIIKYIQESLK